MKTMATLRRPASKAACRLLAQMRLVQRLHHVAVRADALLGLDHAAVQQLGQHDVAVEQARAVLVGDAQRVAKAARGDQQRGLALALQQRVGGHRGAHLHALDLLGRDRLPGRRPSRWRMPATAASRYCSGLSLSSLCVTSVPSGPPAHHVGEGAAAVDPELPAAI
jgi:hypothetical protein